MQEIYFICATDARVLENDFVDLSTLGGRCSTGFSLLIGRSLNEDIDLVFAGDGDRLVVADVAGKSFAFPVFAVYAPNYIGERRTVFRRLDLFLCDLKWIVIVGD